MRAARESNPSRRRLQEERLDDQSKPGRSPPPAPLPASVPAPKPQINVINAIKHANPPRTVGSSSGRDNFPSAEMRPRDPAHTRGALDRLDTHRTVRFRCNERVRSRAGSRHGAANGLSLRQSQRRTGSHRGLGRQHSSPHLDHRGQCVDGRWSIVESRASIGTSSRVERVFPVREATYRPRLRCHPRRSIATIGTIANGTIAAFHFIRVI
jgi:hypothetical protein